MLASGAFNMVRGVGSAVGMMAQDGDVSSGDVNQILSRLRDPRTAQQLSTATGIPQSEVQTTLSNTAQAVERVVPTLVARADSLMCLMMRAHSWRTLVIRQQNKTRSMQAVAVQLAAGPSFEGRYGARAGRLPPEHAAWALEGRYLALGVATLVCALSPQRVIMGGGIMQQMHLFPMVREQVRGLLAGYVQAPEILERIDEYIVPPELGNEAGALGAIALAQS